jgi:hypothetical protein
MHNVITREGAGKIFNSLRNVSWMSITVQIRHETGHKERKERILSYTQQRISRRHESNWARIDKWLYGCGELTEINDCHTTLVPWMPIDHAPRYVTLL